MVRTCFCAFVLVALWNYAEARGQFTTVIDAPPTVIGSNQSIGSDTQLNVLTGGVVGSDFDAGASDGSSTNVEVNLSGGTIGFRFDAYAGSTVNVFDGRIQTSFTAHSGSEVNITGGEVAGVLAGGIINVSGGNVSGLGLESGGKASISASANVSRVSARPGSVVDITGGSVGRFTEAGDSFPFEPGEIEITTVNISAGSVGDHFRADRHSVINISGGTVGNFFNAREFTAVNISGGTVGNGFSTWPFSEINITGGEFGAGSAFGGTTNISGGKLSDIFVADLLDTKINLFGTQFILDGVDITSSLVSGVPFTITDRDVPLTGLLADGSPFDFDLNSTRIDGEDYFYSRAVLTVTLVPEPPSVALLFALFVGVYAKKIAFYRCGN